MALHSVEVDLDGIRRLRFPIEQLRQLQRRLGGLTLLQIAQRLQELDLDLIVWAFWYGLQWDDRRTTPEQVQALIQAHLDRGGGLLEVVNPLVEAFGYGSGLRRAESPPPQGTLPPQGAEGTGAPGT
jgi:hypothetical protein